MTDREKILDSINLGKKMGLWRDDPHALGVINGLITAVSLIDDEQHELLTLDGADPTELFVVGEE